MYDTSTYMYIYTYTHVGGAQEGGAGPHGAFFPGTVSDVLPAAGPVSWVRPVTVAID